MSKAENGQKVSVHYVGTLDDGTEFDSSRERNEPLLIQIGTGQVIAGFDAALTGMTIGETKTIRLESNAAYGDINPDAFQKVPRSSFPDNGDLEIGVTVYGNSSGGQRVSARVDAYDDKDVTLNLNHPLAGKTLNFEIELLSIDV